MTHYAIEARLHHVPELGIRHHYWLLRDLSSGTSIAELHGLPTDRSSGDVEPFGTSRSGHALRAWHFIHVPAEGLWMAPSHTEFGESGLLWDAQTSLAVFVGEAREALMRWNAGASSLASINAVDVDFGAPVDDHGEADDAADGDRAVIDDNTVYATLAAVMDVEPHAFGGLDMTGLAAQLLDGAVLDTLRFRADGRAARVPDAMPVHAPRRADDAPASKGAPSPDQPSHPDHALYQQSVAAVRALDASLGRTPDDASERLAASMLLLARQGGLDRIDHVILSRRTSYVGRGQNVFVVQNDPDSWSHRRAHTDTDAAVTTPVDRTFEKLATLPPRD